MGYVFPNVTGSVEPVTDAIPAPAATVKISVAVERKLAVNVPAAVAVMVVEADVVFATTTPPVVVQLTNS